jgi:hypothetical protein
MIELLLVMSACTVVLTLSSALIVRAMRTQMQSRAYGDAERNALRLSEQFRQDVHAAKSAATSNAAQRGNAFLKLQLATGQQVNYYLADGTVQRQKSGNSHPSSRESFVFPAGIELSVRELSLPPRISLAVWLDPASEVSSEIPRQISLIPPVSLHVEAVLGHDLRLTGRENHGEVNQQ